jgi:hypothetical protein
MMNENNNREMSNLDFTIFIFIAIVAFSAGYIGGHVDRKKDSGNSPGVETNLSRERELLERIGEYELRERGRIAAENSRINRERERVERTKAQLGAIRGLDRRSGGLLQELEQEANILADYFRDSCNIIGYNINSSGSE